jgi:hypothetical protein
MLLKLFHRLLILGSPIMQNAPFNVEPYSTYLNFKLSELQVSKLTNYIREHDDTLRLVPIRISQYESPDYFLSVNIYNVTSPLFMNENWPVTRCELNTYVKDMAGNIGTLILDYCSNGLSIDPVNLVKWPSYTYFGRDFEGNLRSGGVGDGFRLMCEMETDVGIDKPFFVSNDLHKHTDLIYYKNGVYDRIRYDASLVYARVLRPVLRSLTFQYNRIGEGENKLHSVFYFPARLNFLCSIWDNL